MCARLPACSFWDGTSGPPALAGAWGLWWYASGVPGWPVGDSSTLHASECSGLTFELGSWLTFCPKHLENRPTLAPYGCSEDEISRHRVATCRRRERGRWARGAWGLWSICTRRALSRHSLLLLVVGGGRLGSSLVTHVSSQGVKRFLHMHHGGKTAAGTGGGQGSRR